LRGKVQRKRKLGGDLNKQKKEGDSQGRETRPLLLDGDDVVSELTILQWNCSLPWKRTKKDLREAHEAVLNLLPRERGRERRMSWMKKKRK